MYGSKTWILSGNKDSRIQAAEMKYLTIETKIKKVELGTDKYEQTCSAATIGVKQRLPSLWGHLHKDGNIALRIWWPKVSTVVQ